MIIIAGISATWFYTRPTETVLTEQVPVAQPTETVPTPEQTPTGSETVPVASVYKDGTYTADGEYRSPAGNETVTISITLQNDIVTDATFTGHAKNPGSVANQKKFSDGFKSMIVGKSIDSLDLTVVNGSSLTPGGFMDALTKVKAQAKN
jgi:uncharacterized protein with FMN-binding domain